MKSLCRIYRPNSFSNLSLFYVIFLSISGYNVTMLILLLCASLFIDLASAYSNGPPIQICRSMFPIGHEAPPHTHDRPFVVMVNKHTYTAGEELTGIKTSCMRANRNACTHCCILLTSVNIWFIWHSYINFGLKLCWFQQYLRSYVIYKSFRDTVADMNQISIS